MNRRVLCDLFAIQHPRDYLREVLQCLGFGDHREGKAVAAAFQFAHRLYQGEVDGYRECDTRYHDFTHAAEVFLTMGRLLHGARLASDALTAQDIAAGLAAAIFHDAGYIRVASETLPHGARLHAEHEQRSGKLLVRHGESLGFGEQALEDCRAMIGATVMAQDVNVMAFRSESQELMARMLSVADLLAQLSSATYLERLAFLYEEDRESGSPRYEDQLDCYRQALAFDDRARVRIQHYLPETDLYLTRHFAARWKTPANLYRVSMDRQIRYLVKTSAHDAFEPQRAMRRWGSVRAEQRLASLNAINLP